MILKYLKLMIHYLKKGKVQILYQDLAWQNQVKSLMIKPKKKNHYSEMVLVSRMSKNSHLSRKRKMKKNKIKASKKKI